MARETHLLFDAGSETRTNKWARRRDIPIAILAWIALAIVILWGAGHIARSLLLLAIAALLAYALTPAVKILQRFMPRVLAILIVYLLVLSLLTALIYLVISAAVEQTIALSRELRTQLTPGPNGQATPLETTLGSLGISQAQINTAREQILGQAEAVTRNAVPFLRSLFDTIIDTALVAILSIYILIDGSKAAQWVRRNAPRVVRADFTIDTLQRVIGGYIRGQVILSVLIGLMVGLGMGLIFRLPYAVFLGVLAFVMAFIPVIGTFISGAVCVLIGLTHGWLIALGVLVYFVVVHVIEGDIVGPRIVGRAVGLHPVISIFALIAGTELFGIWGALFAAPIGGVLQVIVSVIWREWRTTHPEQFKTVKQDVVDKVDEAVGDKVLAPTPANEEKASDSLPR